MKRIILGLVLALIFCTNASSYTSNVHKYIVEQAYELLKAETCYGYEEYDLGIYCYDENWDPAIIKGVIQEDVYD